MEAQSLGNFIYEFPIKGTRESLEEYGLRYLATQPFIHEGEERIIEYMSIERKGVLLLWKRTSPLETFEFHLEANITRKNPVRL
jgi:hypothetical protein